MHFFSIEEGRNRNLFLQDSLVNVHVLWRTSPPLRLQFCFPEGNSGVGLDLAGRVELSSDVTSWGRLGGLRGAEITLVVQGNLTIGTTCLDSLRTLREWNYPDAFRARAELRRKAEIADPVWSLWTGPRFHLLSQQTAGVARRWDYNLELEYPPQVVWTPASFGGTLSGPPSWLLKIRGGHNHPAAVPLGDGRLLSKAALARLHGLPDGKEKNTVLMVRRNLGFLAYEDKLLAGSWRFLTYFGRDTLMTSLLLGRTGSLALHEAALASVLSRLSPRGQVAHEEDIGEQAAYCRWEDSDSPEPRTLGDAVFDYKMVDDDFLLLPALAAVAEHPEAGPSWWKGFVKRHAPLLDLNADWCLSRLGSLVGLEHETVGEWRDSNRGLGGGFYPNSVNVGIVPAFLDALDRYRPGVSPSVRDFWKGSRERFRVHLDAAELRRRVGRYLAGHPSPAEARWMLDQQVAPGVSIGQWLDGTVVPRLESGLTFPALSLDRSGKPIPVVNSDFSFRLFLSQPEPEELSESFTLLELPFPLGLKHPVGFLVANPALSDDPGLWESLGRFGYHGAVVWAWQDAMLALGLARQAERTDLDADTRLRIRELMKTAAEQRERAGAFVSSELWSWKVSARGTVVPVAFGAEDQAETESNAVQLWSSAALALALG